jgi:hypothetical protein
MELSLFQAAAGPRRAPEPLSLFPERRLKPSASICPAVPPRRHLLHMEYHTGVKSPIPPFIPRIPRCPRRSALAGVVRPPPTVEALIRHPSHLPVALVGFAVLLAPRRAHLHPKPWPLARERHLRRGLR